MPPKLYRSLLASGAGLGLLIVCLAWVKYRLIVLDHAMELYILLMGVVFVALGAWLGSRLIKPQTIIRKEVVIQEVPASSESVLKPVPSGHHAGISQRELEVLQLLSKGLSNEEIAAGLFVSQNTVKTHLSNIYFKLEVRRRTQAIDKARLMGIIE